MTAKLFVLLLVYFSQAGQKIESHVEVAYFDTAEICEKARAALQADRDGNPVPEVVGMTLVCVPTTIGIKPRGVE